MKKGDIIRRIGAVGRYIRVTDIVGDQTFGIYLSKIGNISEETLLPIGMYEIMNIYRLSVSKEDIEILRRYATTISHKATISWEKLIDIAEENRIDLIMFYNGTKKVYYTFEALKRAYRLEWNKSKTICKKEPCITIFLGSLIAIE